MLYFVFFTMSFSGFAACATFKNFPADDKSHLVLTFPPKFDLDFCTNHLYVELRVITKLRKTSFHKTIPSQMQ